MFTYWHITSMNYQKTAQRYMDEGILYDMRNVSCLPILNFENIDYFIVDSNSRP